MAHTYTSEEIERLKQFPGILTVTPRRIVFDLEFRRVLYEEWYLNPSKETIRDSFIAKGAQLQESDDRFITNLHRAFVQKGYPKQQMIYHNGDEMPHKTEEELIDEGVLYRTFEGIRFTQSYLDMLKKAYWDANGEKSVEDIVLESGYAPRDFGKYRLQGLRKRLEKKAGKAEGTERAEGPVKIGNVGKNTGTVIRRKSGMENEQRSMELIWTSKKIEESPFIRKAGTGCYELTEAFFNDAVLFRGLPVADILSIYCLDTIPLPYYDSVDKCLRNWKTTGEVVTFDLPVAVNRFVAMRRLLERALAEAKDKIQLMTPPEKKAACEMIDKLPRDAAGEYKTQTMKSHIMDILALCPDMDTAIRLVEGYMDAYNNENYQYTLAGLTPAEYYFYSVTGVYPCDEYYGVGRDEFLSVKELIAARRRVADLKAAKRRESYAKQKASPKGIVERDLMKTERRLRSLTALKEDTEEEIGILEGLQAKMKEALEFLQTAGAEVLQRLVESNENWKLYPQLAYIYEMDGMF